MAIDAPPKKRGRPSGTTKKNENDKMIKLTLSQRQHAYLCWLVENTNLGGSVELILHKIIAEKLEEMNPSSLRPPST